MAVGSALLVACVIATRAADEPPPLDQIKVDLKAVKLGTMTELSAPSAQPALVVPGFVPPAGEPAPALPASSISSAKKQVADPDWLLHAMNAQPKAKADQQRRANRPDPHPSDVTPQEPTAPDSLLKVYQEQELKDRELRDNAPSQTDLALSKPDDAGLFSGLLQHWISPQDHALLGMDSESPLTDASGLAPPAALSITPPPEGTLSPRSPNPFLDASRLDLRAPDVGTVVALPSEGPAPGPQEWTAPAPPAVQTPPVPARDATPTPQAHPADDKKYFPQLDRF